MPGGSETQPLEGATFLEDAADPLADPLAGRFAALADEELAAGTRVGDYHVVRRVGEGGMGAVYEAIHPLIGRKVAIKVLGAAAGAGAGAAARFLQEARTASMLRHRNVVDVFSFGQLDDGRLYLVMEFLDGETLSDHLERCGPLSFADALPILEGVFAGLEVAHGRGVVHRDLKPENIWLLAADPGAAPAARVEPGRIKLLDFGIAKLVAGDAKDARLTRAGVPMGTPAYMSPEQCRGDADVDARADIYALGVLLFELFTRRVPFSAATFVEVMHQHLTAAPPSLSESGMPEDLAAVIHMALAKDPADRFQSVAQLREALLECESARYYVPVRGAALPPSGVGDTRVGEAPAAPPGTGALPPLEVEGLRVQARLDGGALRVSAEGELEDGPAVRVLAGWLGSTVEAAEDDLSRVVLDLRAVGYLGPQGLSCLGAWIDFLAQARADGLAPTTVVIDEASAWQRAAGESLQRIDPALRLDVA